MDRPQKPPSRRRGRAKHRFSSQNQRGCHDKDSDSDENSHDDNPNKPHRQPPPKDLLIFGYASRIFRDDEKARQMEKGAFLIPWSGDKSLMIDRYDCRGHLHNLREYDGATAASWVAPQPNEEEAKLEAKCQQERYRDLAKIQQKERQRKAAEKQKILEREYVRATASPSPPPPPPPLHSGESARNQGFHAIPFSYDAVPPPPPAENGEVPEQEKPAEDEDIISASVSAPSTGNEKEMEPFVPREDFDIPSHICLPQYKRLNTIIERTASFIAEKGPQLEVLIRAKQGSSESFRFLQPSDVLHPYFRFLVDSIKSGVYKPAPESSSSSSEGESEDDDDGNYLHPSLLQAAKKPAPPPELSPAAAKVFAEPSPFSSLYGSLIHRVQAATNPRMMEGGRPAPEMTSTMEKMAMYVVKNGPQFEKMIRNRHGPDDSKFGFIHGYHPYHSLYDEMKRNIRADMAKGKHTPVELATVPVPEVMFQEELLPPPPPPPPPRIPETVELRLTPPPPPPPPPPPRVEDPRIAELKRKALEASLRISEKLRERQSNGAVEAKHPAPVLFTVTVLGIFTTQHYTVKTKEKPPPVERRIRDLEDVVLPIAPPVRKETKAVVAEKNVEPGSLLELLVTERTGRMSEERGSRKEKKRKHSRSKSPHRHRNHSRERSRRHKRDREKR